MTANLIVWVGSLQIFRIICTMHFTTNDFCIFVLLNANSEHVLKIFELLCIHLLIDLSFATYIQNATIFNYICKQLIEDNFLLAEMSESPELSLLDSVPMKCKIAKTHRFLKTNHFRSNVEKQLNIIQYVTTGECVQTYDTIDLLRVGRTLIPVGYNQATQLADRLCKKRKVRKLSPVIHLSNLHFILLYYLLNMSLLGCLRSHVSRQH